MCTRIPTNAYWPSWEKRQNVNHWACPTTPGSRKKDLQKANNKNLKKETVKNHHFYNFMTDI